MQSSEPTRAVAATGPWHLTIVTPRTVVPGPSTTDPAHPLRQSCGNHGIRGVSILQSARHSGRRGGGRPTGPWGDGSERDRPGEPVGVRTGRVLPGESAGPAPIAVPGDGCCRATAGEAGETRRAGGRSSSRGAVSVPFARRVRARGGHWTHGRAGPFSGGGSARTSGRRDPSGRRARGPTPTPGSRADPSAPFGCRPARAGHSVQDWPAVVAPRRSAPAACRVRARNHSAEPGKTDRFIPCVHPLIIAPGLVADLDSGLRTRRVGVAAPGRPGDARWRGHPHLAAAGSCASRPGWRRRASALTGPGSTGSGRRRRMALSGAGSEDFTRHRSDGAPRPPSA